MSHAAELRQQLAALVSDGMSRLVIDLAAVTSMDSAAIGALIAGLKQARKAGGDLRIVAPSMQVSEVLKMTKLTRLLVAYDSVGAAFDR